MIITFVIVLISLLFTLWIVTMHATWKMEQDGTLPLFSTEPIETSIEKMTRLVRRAYYQAVFRANVMLAWMQKQFGTMFFNLFPKAQPAFAKKDSLAGLTDGPSSYFLLTLSEKPKEIVKSTRRRRKIV